MDKALYRRTGIFFFILLSALVSLYSIPLAEEEGSFIDLGISAKYYEEGKLPQGWRLKSRIPGIYKAGEAGWVMDEGVPAIKFHSKDALTFMEKDVDIDVREYPVVSWKWKVENILKDINERKQSGDDHPIRIFLVFAPDPARQSWWFKVRRFVYLDRIYGHPAGGRFTEYLWSSYLKPGEVINDPEHHEDRLITVEGGSGNLGKWLSYRRNLYEDYKSLYNEEPTRLVFIGIIDDTDDTGQEATSYITDLIFEKAPASPQPHVQAGG